MRVGSGYSGPQPTPQLHPHLRLEETMTSVPKVNPGDMVFWHCVSVPIRYLTILLCTGRVSFFSGRGSFRRAGTHWDQRLGR